EAGIVYCRLKVGKELVENAFYFVDFKEVQLTPARINVSRKEVGNITVLTLSSNQLVRHLELSTSDGNLWFDDNYFDLYPGIQKIVRIKSMKKLPIAIQALNTEKLIIY
ncbi:MAG: hypothetical protein QME64_01890, partial [bacterium]|nr:hypothetical protein [bacterium]